MFYLWLKSEKWFSSISSQKSRMNISQKSDCCPFQELSTIFRLIIFLVLTYLKQTDMSSKVPGDVQGAMLWTFPLVNYYPLWITINGIGNLCERCIQLVWKRDVFPLFMATSSKIIINIWFIDFYFDELSEFFIKDIR